MTTSDITTALERYGASLDNDGYICRDGRRTSVTLSVKGKRLTAEGNGLKLYTGPAAAASVARFVEGFWFWTPRNIGAVRS